MSKLRKNLCRSCNLSSNLKASSSDRVYEGVDDGEDPRSEDKRLKIDVIAP